ncbi:MAG: globin family protein [Ferruginibacter sp.]
MNNADLINCSGIAAVDKGMTSQQVILIQKSWKFFRGIKPEIVGDVFYSKLFTDVPVTKRLFKTPMTGQYTKLIDMISMIVGRLHHIEEVTGDIREMAKRHVGYGVKPAHYKAVGDALLWTLEQGLGRDWDGEVKEAWTKCYKLLADTMIEASKY